MNGAAAKKRNTIEGFGSVRAVWGAGGELFGCREVRKVVVRGGEVEVIDGDGVVEEVEMVGWLVWLVGGRQLARAVLFREGGVAHPSWGAAAAGGRKEGGPPLFHREWWSPLTAGMRPRGL